LGGQAAATKISGFFFSEIRVFLLASPLDERGVRVVTDVERGMRWTRSCVSTSAIFADGEVVWSWHPGAGVKFAILFDEPVNDGGNQAGPRGEHV
jgi:hypothetical protein